MLHNNKLLIRNQSVNIRALFETPEKTYIVRIQNYDKRRRKFKKPIMKKFTIFSKALDCVNFQKVG